MRSLKVNCDTAFFEAVSMWLANTSIQRCRGQLEFKSITGDLTQPDYQAKVNIVFCPSKLKKLAPIVYCNESWIRRENDWHCLRVNVEGHQWHGHQQMCWIHPAEWRLAHSEQRKRINSVINEGSEWLRNNLTQLLGCHWVGHFLGIKKWRPEWGGWAHGDEGTREFMSESRSNGLPHNWHITSSDEVP
jgi:hypothetical protein